MGMHANEYDAVIAEGSKDAMASVASMLMDKEQAVSEAGQVWLATVAQIPAIKAKVREEAEALIETETKRRREAAAKAIYAAREAGATKVSLREVTTKDHWDFEDYLKLGEELAKNNPM